jgi:hypothetical protein
MTNQPNQSRKAFPSRLMQLGGAILCWVALLTLFACHVQVRSGKSVIKSNLTVTSLTTEHGLWMVEYEAEGDTLVYAII